MLIFNCTRRIVCNSYKFQLQNASSATFKLFSSEFSGLCALPAATDPSSCDRKQEKSQAVITFLRNHGFSNTQISKLVQKHPRVHSADPKKSLLPKIEFLSSVGISATDIPAIILRTPHLLARSLEKTIVPGHNFLKSVLLNDTNVVRSIKRDSRILLNVAKGPVAMNIDLLRGVGVPQPSISFLLLRFPYIAYQNHDKFKKCVEDVIKMDFDPLKIIFVQAVQVKCETSKPTWDGRVEVYRRWGLSNEDILLAFKKHPFFMTVSEQKITRVMDLFVNEMRWKPAIIVRNPQILFFSLEKRSTPRCCVIKILISKDLVNKTLAPATFLQPGEKQFLDLFVRKYEVHLPGLINIYHGAMNLSKPEFVAEDSPVM